MENDSFEPDLSDAGGKKSPAGPARMDSTSLDIPEKTEIPDKPYAGMGKEDLLRFSQTPFWNTFRMVCLIIFWAAWVALLAAVVVLTVVAPRCSPPPEQTWWQRTVAYQVYVRSFYDTDGNGIGDINGVTAKLDYMQTLNVETVTLSAFYPSHYSDPTAPDSNMGYDVTDHMAVDPDYGTMDDFENLLKEAHDRDMKVVIDFIPNHTGTLHPWFVASAADTTNSNANFYVWKDCTGGTLPETNWLSVYGESAWVQDPAVLRGQCYLNQFLTNKVTGGALSTAGYQPDLNLRSSGVRAALEEILRFWLDLGVDGFRVMDTKFLFEDNDMTNENEICTDTSDYNCRDHSRTTNQAETYEIIGTWRGILDEYSTDQTKILITDARDTLNNTLKYYGNQDGSTGAHLPLNYRLQDIVPGISLGVDVKDVVDDYLAILPGQATADWLTGDQESPRVATGISEQYSRSLAILKMTLPGPPIIYYGEELDMVDGTGLGTEDPTGLGRDNYRTLMQWDSTPNGGFQNGTNATGTASPPWVDVNPDFNIKNVEAFDVENSTLGTYRTLGALRRTENGLAYGLMEYAVVDANVFSFVRQFDGTNRFLVAINFGAQGEFDLTTGDAAVPGSAELIVSSQDGGVGGRKVGDSVDLKKVALGPGEGAVFVWPFSR